MFGLHTEVHDCCFAAEHVVDADIVDADIRFCRSCEQSRKCAGSIVDIDAHDDKIFAHDPTVTRGDPIATSISSMQHFVQRRSDP